MILEQGASQPEVNRHPSVMSKADRVIRSGVGNSAGSLSDAHSNRSVSSSTTLYNVFI